ncbi:MAG: hypothetical protein AB3N09_09240 [Tateyamaria sp.]
MSILSIIGGGGSAQPTQPSANDQTTDAQDTDEAASAEQDSATAPSGNSAQTQDTTAPAAATGTDQSTATAASDTTDPATEAARASEQSGGSDGSTAQSAVEAALIESPEKAEADARRFAEAAQQQQRLELLIEAVKAPAETTDTPAPMQAQENVGPIEADGVPV